jgi:hypothetical protein
MARVERIREMVSGPMTAEYMRQRSDAGWRMSAVVWERDLPPDAPAGPTPVEDVPYGLKISEDCLKLEEDLEERQALILMLEQIIQDKSLSVVAEELNKQGLRTRNRTKWTPGAVFDMLPRLIEVGPRVFTSEEWVVRRGRLMNVV